MNLEERYADLCKQLDSDIKCWDDLYTYFDVLAGAVRDHPGPISLMNGFFTMYAFILALRDMPEEGDALVLAKKMMRNLTLDAGTVLGFDLTVGSEEDIIKAKLMGVVSALRAMSEAVETAPQETPQAEAGQGSSRKPTLH